MSGGKEWSAVSKNLGESIGIGEEVKVLRIDGVKLVVEENKEVEKES